MNEFLFGFVNRAGRRIPDFMRPVSRALSCGVFVFFLSACAGGVRSLAPEEMVAVSIGAVGHYGSMIGIPEFTVNGHWGGNNSGWGGGGGGVCCVLLPAKVSKPMTVTVKWKTCDIGEIEFRNNKKVDPEARCKSEEHQKTVPVHLEVQPGDGGTGLFVHFLPGHRAEVWYTVVGPSGRAYPGPAYPRGPAPRYAPIRDEKQQLPLSKKEEIR